MSIDSKVHESVKKAVEDARQPESLATKIIAWLDSVVSGNEDINDSESALRHLELIYGETKVIASEEGEDECPPQ